MLLSKGAVVEGDHLTAEREMSTGTLSAGTTTGLGTSQQSVTARVLGLQKTGVAARPSDKWTGCTVIPSFQRS